MKKNDLVTSISISVELLMFGNVAFNICQNGIDINVSWLAIADGGDIISNESMRVKNKNISELVEKLISIKLPKHEDFEMSRAWSISFNDDKNNQIKGIDSGFWDISVLNKIVNLIDCVSGNRDVTEWLHTIIEA